VPSISVDSRPECSKYPPKGCSNPSRRPGTSLDRWLAVECHTGQCLAAEHELACQKRWQAT